MSKCYRYKEQWFANRSTPSISLIEFDILKETPQGYWIIESFMNYWYMDKEEKDKIKRWVKKDAKNSHAYDSKEKAWINFKKRKERQIEIVQDKLRRAKATLSEIKKYEENDKISEIHILNRS